MNNNTPILVANTEWDLPDKLIRDIQVDRMILELCNFTNPDKLKKEDLISWSECIGYLMPATNRNVLRSDVSRIYLFCVKKYCEERNIKVLKEIQDIELSNQEQAKLQEYKEWIYKERGGQIKNPILNALKEVFKLK